MFNEGYIIMVNMWLVVTGTMEFYDFPYIGNVIIPTDFHIFSEGLKPPTSTYIILGYFGDVPI